LRFRAPNETASECVQGEPQVFCKDLFFRDHGKIMVVPSVNFGYNLNAARKIKQKLGFVSDKVKEQDRQGDKIQWLGPPDKVKCIEPWSKQFWQPWNATLVDDS
jgi:alpha-1,3-mannosyltransferase